MTWRDRIKEAYEQARREQVGYDYLVFYVPEGEDPETYLKGLIELTKADNGNYIWGDDQITPEAFNFSLPLRTERTQGLSMLGLIQQEKVNNERIDIVSDAW